MCIHCLNKGEIFVNGASLIQDSLCLSYDTVYLLNFFSLASIGLYSDEEIVCVVYGLLKLVSCDSLGHMLFAWSFIVSCVQRVTNQSKYSAEDGRYINFGLSRAGFTAPEYNCGPPN